MAGLTPSKYLAASTCPDWSYHCCPPNIGQRQPRTITWSNMEWKLRRMRMGALCCGDSKQDKNESTMTHLPICQSFELLQAPSNIKHLKQHSWQAMLLISVTTFRWTWTNFKEMSNWTQLNSLLRKTLIDLIKEARQLREWAVMTKRSRQAICQSWGSRKIDGPTNHKLTE